MAGLKSLYGQVRMYVERKVWVKPFLTGSYCLILMLLLAWFVLFSDLNMPREFIYNQF
jgi:hypothetical protein